MSPSTKPVRNINVRVPRHNSQRIGPAVTAHVESLARTQRVRVDIRQTARDPSSALAQAIESASDWNSLLMTARAQRGPQWDIGTQQFLVEEDSELYYDPSPLLEYQKDGRTGDGDEPSSSTSAHQRLLDFPHTPHTQRTSAHGPHTPHGPTGHAPPPQYYNAPQHSASPRHPYAGTPGMPFNGMNAVSPAQFYGGGGASDSPMRMGRSPGMGMGVGGPMGMNMNMAMHAPDGMGMGMGSPDVRRRVTRGMSAEDGFGGMHG
ncbi:hypothetical protein B0H21DRAFT_694446 [Amylocystis lapponica]|nr:hypothetical protein B0H21DRAFT_694446 [Amylocystis lapponica]